MRKEPIKSKKTSESLSFRQTLLIKKITFRYTLATKI